MDVCEERLHTGYQLFAVEQLADRDRSIQRRSIAPAPGLGAEVCIEICGCRDAAREGAATRLDQRCFGRGKDLEARLERGGRAGIGHVARGILQAYDAGAV